MSSSGSRTGNDLEKEIEQIKKRIEEHTTQMHVSKCLLKVLEFEHLYKNADNVQIIEKIKKKLKEIVDQEDNKCYVSASIAMGSCFRFFEGDEWLAVKNTFDIEYTKLEICHENKEIALYRGLNEEKICRTQMSKCRIAVLKVKLKYLKQQEKEFPKYQENDHDNIFEFLYAQLNVLHYDKAIKGIISGVLKIKGTDQPEKFSSAIETFNQAEKILLEKLIVKLENDLDKQLGVKMVEERYKIEVQLLKCQIEVCKLQLLYMQNGNDDWKKYCKDIYWGLKDCKNKLLDQILKTIDSYIKSMNENTQNNDDWNECREVFIKACDALKNLQNANEASELLGICRRALRSELKNSEALSENHYKRIRNKLYMIEDNINDGEDLQTIIDEVASCRKELPNHSETKEVFRDAHKELIVLKNEQEDLLDKLYGF